MAVTVAARNVHFRIAALHHRRIAERFRLRFLVAARLYRDQSRVSKLKKRSSDPLPGTIQR